MSLDFHPACTVHPGASAKPQVARLWQHLQLVLLAVLCALPFGVAFIATSPFLPYLALVAFVPSMYVIRRLKSVGYVISFAVLCSLAGNVMVTFWLPDAIKEAVSATTLVSVLVAAPLWAFWCIGMSLFLVVYRYFHGTRLGLVACVGVLLVNYWPSIFGISPFLMLMHAKAVSGGAFFIGTAGVEWLTILISAYLASALLRAGDRPARRAVLLLATLLALDSASALYQNSTPSRGLNVALVQAHNVYAEKLSSAQNLESFVQEILNDGGLRPDLVVFPESVFTFDMTASPQNAKAAIDALERVSREQDVAFLLSLVEAQSPDTATSTSTSKVSSRLINEGRVQGVADKARTIPFAEYTPEWAVPLIKLLGAQVQTRPPGTQYSPMQVKGIPIVPLSCFESLDQSLVERRLNGRPALLVNQSNLDTFGFPGLAPYQAVLWQHMSYEQRWANQWQVPVARAVSSGGSTVIAADGTVDLTALNTSWAQEFVKGRVAIREPLPLDGAASYVRTGLRGLVLFLAGCFLVFCAIKVCRRRRGQP